MKLYEVEQIAVPVYMQIAHHVIVVGFTISLCQVHLLQLPLIPRGVFVELIF
jgi:hypothetical protein